MGIPNASTSQPVNIPDVSTATKYYVNGQEVPPPPPTQMDRIERLLTEIRDALAQRPITFGGGVLSFGTPLASNPQDEVGGAMLAAMPPPPAQTWTPAPGKAGPAWCYPNPANTPGAANPLVTQETIASTIAVPNWTSTVRPPVSVTRIIKAHIMARDGLTGDPSQWELDHWWPICAGGAVCDLANFWCMPYSPYPGAREKDHVEVWLKEQIVAGRMTLEAAHQALNDDWYAIFLSIRRLGLMPMMAAYDPDGSSDPDDDA
jgi:hypothetical protein